MIQKMPASISALVKSLRWFHKPQDLEGVIDSIHEADIFWRCTSGENSTQSHVEEHLAQSQFVKLHPTVLDGLRILVQLLLDVL
jgi:hypothetical protein